VISRRLEQLFLDPPRTFSPTPLWWWSGGKVTGERIRWQMERFPAGGVFNLVVINLAPAGPIVGARGDDPRWFSDEWWDRFTDACAAARDLDMKLWFYDQIGFSGANVQGSITQREPSAAGRALRHRTGRPVPAAAEEILAAYRPDGTRVPQEQWTGQPELRLVTSVPTAFDYLDRDAVGLLLDSVHGEFDRRVAEFLGDVVVGSFQDELPSTNTWTPRFGAEFSARMGYDLLDHLPALWEVGGRHAAKVRGDYYAVRTALTEEALFRPLARWHEERGMLIGSDQSNPARAGNPTQATQLYTDYFRTHRWYSAAGSDHEGDAKVHSSMAHLYGHERVWLEAFHSSGWGGTLEDTYDWLMPFLRSGANLYNPHATYFDTAGGWFEWAPPSTDWRQPYWATYPAFAGAVSRIASIMSWGGYCADVAVLHPTATAQAWVTLDAPVDHFGDGSLGGPFADVDQTQQHYLGLCGANNWFVTRPGLLDRAGVSFDVVDDASLQRADVAAGGLVILDLRYTTVILPSAGVLEEATARKLHAFVESGGQLILVGRLPCMAAGTAGDDAVVRALADHPGVLRVATPEEAVARIRTAPYARSDVPLLVRRSGDDAVALVPGAFPNASGYPLRTDTWRWDDYDFDPARYASVREVTVAAQVAEAECWNPATGERRPVPVRAEGGISRIAVPLEGSPGVLLVWREGAPTTDVPATPRAHPDRERRSLALDDGWTGTLVPTMDNTWGDLARPVGSDVAQLQVWTSEWAESDGAAPSDWSPTRATFGQRLRVLGPLADGNAPAPLTPEQVEAVLEGATPLTDGAWAVHTWSAERGLEKDPGLLGNKGMVPEEFVQVVAPADGEVSIIRALLRAGRRGPADLVVAAAAAKQVWWNGHELPCGNGYLTAATIVLDRDVNVLEYRLGPSERVPGFSLSGAAPTLGSFFAITAPGAMARRPTFMTAGEHVVPGGSVAFTAELDLPAAATRAVLTIGAATALTVEIDGSVVARQEKVEYYESSWGANPMFFGHDVTGHLGEGRHVVRIVTDSADARDVVFVDLVAEHDAGVSVLVSGGGWATVSGATAGTSREHRGRWYELAHAHAASRPHPLPGTAWLGGEPLVDGHVEPVSSSDSVVPAAQWFRFRVPAGATEVVLPVRDVVEVRVDGQEAALSDGVVHLPAPLRRPAEVTVRTAPTAFDRAGAAWSAAARVRTSPSPIDLGDWQEIGLRAWSGGVRYERVVDIPDEARDVILDLGRLRGTARVSVDGLLRAELFCAPFRVPLGNVSGRVVVEVLVHNTLGPFLDESTPTTWTFPSQLRSGLFGPVTLDVEAPR
jgi:hypothetical protein